MTTTEELDDNLNETVERIVTAITDAIEDLDDEIGVDPSHVLFAVTALSVRFCWALSKDKSEVRSTLAALIDDYATQSEFGPMGDH